MSAGVPIGYWITCDYAICAECAPQGFVSGDYSQWLPFETWESPLPIFESDESDSPTHCAQCEALIAHALTPEGYRYVLGSVLSWLFNHYGRESILRQWVGEYRMRGLDDGEIVEAFGDALDAWSNLTPVEARA